LSTPLFVKSSGVIFAKSSASVGGFSVTTGGGGGGVGGGGGGAVVGFGASAGGGGGGVGATFFFPHALTAIAPTSSTATVALALKIINVVSSE
jgi:hypothetical protein